MVILDCYNLLFRAFYAVRFMSTSDGRPTNALFGFTSMLLHLLDRENPDAIVVAIDGPGKTFRHADYPEYKGTRKETAQELIEQFPVVRQMVSALGIPCIEVTGYEADDVVGTISRLAEQNKYNTTIVTGDLDCLQLVDEWVCVMSPRQGVTDTLTYTREKVVERYGFGPEYVTDYKAIAGDTSDNIPGVPGIGEKGATALIQKFGHVDDILERWDEVEPKYQKKIEPARELMLKSKWLATIDRHVPVDYDFKPFEVDETQIVAAESMFDNLEFRAYKKRARTILSRYSTGALREAPIAEEVMESLEVHTDKAASYDALRDWVSGKPFALLFEAPTEQMGMFDEPEKTGVVAVGKEVRKCPESWAKRLVLERPAQAILHDGKSIYHSPDAPLAAPLFDTALAAYVLQSSRGSYSVADLVRTYLDIAQPTTIDQMSAALWHLEPAMKDRLKKEEQDRVLYDIELPLMPVLAEMERIGIKTSKETLEDFSKSLQIEIEKLAQTIYDQAGQNFTIGSPKQLGDILFEKLQIPGPKKGKNGYPTGAEILQPLVAEHQIVGDVLSWREYSKLKSTYSDALPRMIKEDGRIHTSFNQMVAATGRLSSNDPNLQNIPIRTELGRQIRGAFIAEEGYTLTSFDYSQIELRLLAHLCKDEALVDAFQNGQDIHSATASLMFNTELENVSKDQRRYAKTLNFAVLYGVTDFGLAAQLGGEFSIQEAKALIEQYFARFPKVKAFTEGVVAEARSKGFTTTLYGRRRYFPDIHSQNRNERMGVERQAVNAPIQGAAADMVKLAMIKARQTLGSAATRMLLQVHDEIVFEMLKEEKELMPKLRSDMESAMPLDVPVEVDSKSGPTWNDMTKV